MKGWWWISSWHKHITTKLLRWHTYIVTPVRQQLTTALVTSGILLVMYELYHWYILSPLIIICVLVCALLFLMLSEKQYTSTPDQTALLPQNEESLPPITRFEFPETPVPSTPLIRVMETIDLSSSGVEHFIHTTADQRSINNRRSVRQTSDQQSINNRRSVGQTSDQRSINNRRSVGQTSDQRSINNWRTVEQISDQRSINNRRTVEQTSDQQKPHDV